MVALGCSDDDDAGVGPGPDTTGVNLGTGDTGILNYAYALEQLEAAFYTQVVASFYAGATANEQTILTDIRNHEVIHRDFLKAALGTSAIADLQVDFTSINFADRASVLGAAKTFEDLGVSAYNGAGQLLTDAGQPAGRRQDRVGRSPPRRRHPGPAGSELQRSRLVCRRRHGRSNHRTRNTRARTRGRAGSGRHLCRDHDQRLRPADQLKESITDEEHHDFRQPGSRADVQQVQSRRAAVSRTGEDGRRCGDRVDAGCVRPHGKEGLRPGRPCRRGSSTCSTSR